MSKLFEGCRFQERQHSCYKNFAHMHRVRNKMTGSDAADSCRITGQEMGKTLEIETYVKIVRGIEAE